MVHVYPARVHVLFEAHVTIASADDFDLIIHVK
jgi:hypothetical protein